MIKNSVQLSKTLVLKSWFAFQMRKAVTIRTQDTKSEPYPGQVEVGHSVGGGTTKPPEHLGLGHSEQRGGNR